MVVMVVDAYYNANGALIWRSSNTDCEEDGCGRSVHLIIDTRANIGASNVPAPQGETSPFVSRNAKRLSPSLFSIGLLFFHRRYQIPLIKVVLRVVRSRRRLVIIEGPKVLSTEGVTQRSCYKFLVLILVIEHNCINYGSLTNFSYNYMATSH